MGTIHKFKRPPKNVNQFKGYQPMGQTGLGRAQRPWQRFRPWQRLRPWQRSLIGWALLIAIAAAIVGVRKLLGATG